MLDYFRKRKQHSSILNVLDVHVISIFFYLMYSILYGPYKLPFYVHVNMLTMFVMEAFQMLSTELASWSNPHGSDGSRVIKCTKSTINNFLSKPNLCNLN